jgi:hypothetical protein
MTALTITTCKRINLFEKTILSFVKECEDCNLIDIIIHYDDSSSLEDRDKMFSLLNSLFPNTIIVSKRFNYSSFNTNRRHLEIMKIWKNDIKLFNVNYVFHLEDDWFFDKPFTLNEGIELLKNNNDVGLVGFSWKQKKFPQELFEPRIIGNFWEWYYSDKHSLNEPLFDDVVEISQYNVKGLWIKYINWPYFGFRPAIHDVNKINEIETFNDNMESFELEFAIRFAKKFKSFLHLEKICYHIGDENSSYKLNNSSR